MASRESSLIFSLERGLGIALQERQEKKALTSRGRGLLRGFLELRRPWGFSHEARRGSQGASRAAPGKSGLHERGKGERVIVLESWEGTRASRRVEEGLTRSFSACSGKPSFPSTSPGDLRELPMVPLRGEGCCGVGGPSRDSSGFGAIEEGLISRGDRTSGFLSVSYSDSSVPAALGQESQASSCLRKGTPLASRVAQGVSVPSWSCVWKPRVFPDDARECQCPFVLFLHSQGGLRRGVRASGSPQLRTGKSGSFNMGHQPRGLSRISSRGRPHPEGRRAGREPLPDHAGESTLLSRTGEE